MDELIKKKLQTIILKSERSLRIADGLINQGDYDVACSRAYYCAFYIMEGLLITKGLEFSKHSSVMGAFNKYFIHSGEFPKDLSKKVNNLFGQRQIADYDFEEIITEEMALEDIEIARTILEEGKKYLLDNGFM